MLFFLKSQQLRTQNQDNLERTCKTPHIHLRMMIVTTIWLLPETLISTTPNHSKEQTTVSNILSVVLFSACNYDCNILHKWSSLNSFKATAKYIKSLQQQQQASRSQFPTAHKIHSAMWHQKSSAFLHCRAFPDHPVRLWFPHSEVQLLYLHLWIGFPTLQVIPYNTMSSTCHAISPNFWQVPTYGLKEQKMLQHRLELMLKSCYFFCNFSLAMIKAQ